MKSKIKTSKSQDANESFILSSLGQMRKKLLDLTARNRLLNFPITNKTSSLRIVDELPEQLYDTLAAEEPMEFGPVPEPTREQLLEFGYLEVGPDKKVVQLKAHPTAVEWAKVLGINTAYTLPGGDEKDEQTSTNKKLLERAKGFISEYLGSNSGKLTGIRSHYESEGFQLESLSAACHQAGYKDLSAFERHVKAGHSVEIVKVQAKHTDDKIQVLLFPGELEARLRAIYNKAQTAIEESGANILYLALGFLEWYEADNSDKERLAPLFSIPVRLERGKLDPKEGLYKFQLFYTGEDILPNLSLMAKLQTDFAIALPNFQDDQSPEEYLAEVSRIIQKHKHQWSVKRFGCLGLLNFGKMIMYQDLDPDNWPAGGKNIVEHDVIRRFFVNKKGGEHVSDGIGAVEYDIDNYVDIHNKVPLIDDADSSQHSALIDAIQGSDLVIEGPPGSGKSQTITNLIAAALLNGKNVLFVAEKMAALEVVKSRLDRAGLGEFCLELHSHKTHKRKVLDDIQARVSLNARMPSRKEIEAQILRYEELKQQLNEYAGLINREWEQTGKTIHEILSAATRYRTELNMDATKLHVENVSGKNLDKVKQLRLQDQITTFQQIYIEIREQLGTDVEIYDHPWSGVTNTDIQIFDSERIVGLLEQWQSSLNQFSGEFSRLLDDWNIEQSGMDSLSLIEDAVSDLSTLRKLSGDELFSALEGVASKSAIDELRSYLSKFTELQEYYQRLESQVRPEKLASFEHLTADNMPQTGLESFYVSSDLSIKDLVHWVISLNKTSQQLAELSSPLVDLKQSLPSVIANGVTNSRDGLAFSAELLQVIAALPIELMHLRSEVFDDDLIDTILKMLSKQCKVLKSLKDSLKQTFLLEQLPESDVLVAAALAYQQGGIFSWFSGEWRQARSLLKNIIHPTQKLAQAKGKLDELTKYSAELKQFEACNYGHKLGSAYSGIDTDVDSLCILRNWYLRVREAYGIGFGPNVAIGSAVLALDSSLIKGVHQLEKQHLSTTLQETISRIDNLLQRLPLKLDNEEFRLQPWLGHDSILLSVSAKVQHALEQLQGWFISDNTLLHDAESLVDSIAYMQTLHAELKEREALLAPFKADIRPLVTGPKKDNSQSLSVINSTISLAEHIVYRIKVAQIAQCVCSIDDVKEYQQLQQSGTQLQAKWSKQLELEKSFSVETQLDNKMWFKPVANTMSGLISRNNKAIEQPRWLNGWVNFIRNRDQMLELGLERIWQAVFEGTLAIEQTDVALNLALNEQLSREIIKKLPELARISGTQRNAIQSKFKEYDKKLFALQRQKIAAQIASRSVPEGNSGGRKSEYTDFALINNELGKKTRHIPIRQLVNRAGHALVALKPCFMMGPMSAAHYLAPGNLEFDLVVMDEASQVKPEDALGVIARGKQIVVVGDPKQLPPTSFFDRSADDDEGEGEEVSALSETDSILDASLPLFPMRRLRWHYRSQHEKLIAYSNRHFYNSDLVIFPSPNAYSPDYGIKFTYVPNGRFTNQHNIEEANVVAKAVVRHAQMRRNESIGIVAMSSKQRDQIERALDELCRSDSAAEAAINTLRLMDEPLFIKNLENVQGDERDVIYISFTYGPAEVGGKVYQRFGPINSDVGWRRLNVLFTRSKKRMHVFSSMKSEDVQTSENSKRGVIALKGFLHFAEHGMLDAIAGHTGRAPDSDFEVAVIEALSREGFECEPQVGVAGFFIDIAVKDPGKPGRYLMGIECDGAAYHSAKSARDRDRLRQEVLERLGWNIRRIWSTDWFGNPEEVLAPIVRELHEMKSEMPEELLSPVLEVVASELTDENLEPQLIMESTADFSLKEKLRHFAKNVIEPAFPQTDEDSRLLRPAMIEALIEHEPLSRSEFVERIPQYLRQATHALEAQKYLDQVLALIDGEYSSSDVVRDEVVNT
ncbi:DUF4011 domain-containing anti-phage protein Hhe [Shewanella algae]|uniref:DUF4011 domain-containing anti-phage protein Hhe n=1 Tax=Shewanella algae TaxID=38313 RepID=UPI00118324BA|nr:DUF4011 domain-containing anti-phage protein Hhe [Shewanella algae]TVL33701.1 DNA helicase UvrD [Shewanella algae]